VDVRQAVAIGTDRLFRDADSIRVLEDFLAQAVG
jgi:hypothetical protein